MLMVYLEVTIYEVTDSGMNKTAIEDSEHVSFTNLVLDNPNAFHS
ncbi:hypothetical protein BN863_1180 [Formosa agariphila KMM 3901]|uniref:Uncharacterized protein n=1 Tax=Formosa agariphila (strain DSM 15362 / KCTC 12365 / LMG 23005 / KMM 3901 / M-2Alg 35-1) TaxID=1347342 RepID=T2KGF6_FORAG|nr:hypothetical protein BN863_1180 [Formosa agariphila KMM 3901]